MSRVSAFVFLLAMGFHAFLAGAAFVCEHDDGSRNVEWSIIALNCHEAEFDECEPSPSSLKQALESCSDERLPSQELALRQQNDLPASPPLDLLPALYYCPPNVPAGSCVDRRSFHDGGAMSPPNAPLLAISTIVLLV